MTYFSNLPLVGYNNNISRNLLLKSAIVKNIFNRINVFYNYIVPEGYRPDMVAYEEYGSSDYDWIVYLSNNIVDPYHDWPIDYKNFKGYLESKYGTDVYTLQSQILHYKYTGITNEDPDQVALITWTMTPETHALIAATEPESLSGWSPVYVYDYEDEINDAKRSIKLISKSYLSQIERELSVVFKT